jgi:hypothetical protein
MWLAKLVDQSMRYPAVYERQGVEQMKYPVLLPMLPRARAVWFMGEQTN